MIQRTFIKNRQNSPLQRLAIWLSLAVYVLLLPCIANASDIRLFAAASTTKPVIEILALFSKRNGTKAVPVFAASGALARQIDQGAPADIFLSANPRWMDWLEARKRLRPGSRRDLIGNCLALIQPQGEAAFPLLASDSANMFEKMRFAIGDPAYVPAGEYVAKALKRLGLWDSIAPRAARMPSVRHVLYLLERGEADAGLVYRSDALTSARVHIAETIDPTYHDDIVYPVAQIDRLDASMDTRSLFKFLTTATALAIFEQYGFRLLEKKCSD